MRGIDHGPANRNVEQAYSSLRTVREAFRVPGVRPKGKVRRALAFLHRGAEQGVSFIDDTRCLLYILDELANPPTEFIILYDEFWPMYGALSGEVLRRQHTHITVDVNTILGRFSNCFLGLAWPLRWNVVEAFHELAVRAPERPELFWQTTDVFLKSCVEGAAEHGMSNAVLRTVEALVRFWQVIATLHGEHEDDKRRVLVVAPALLALIMQTQVNDYLATCWKETILLLPFSGLGERRASEHLHFMVSGLATKLAELAKAGPPDSFSHIFFEKLLPDLMPYLHGRLKRDARLVLPSAAANATVILQSDIQVTGMVIDVCQTGRGMCIEIDEVAVHRTHEGDIGFEGRQINGFRCRAVSGVRNGIPIVIREMTIQLTYAGNYTLQEEYQVLRAWPVSEDRSGWVVYTSSSDLPESWRAFLRTLPTKPYRPNTGRT